MRLILAATESTECGTGAARPDGRVCSSSNELLTRDTRALAGPRPRPLGTRITISPSTLRTGGGAGPTLGVFSSGMLVFFLLILSLCVQARGSDDLALHIVYVTNRDRPPIDDYRARVGRMMVDVQAFYRDEMARNGHGEMTFPLDLDASAKVVIHDVVLDQDFDPSRKWAPNDLRPAIAKVMAAKGVDIENDYFVAFLNAYWKDGDVWKYDVVYTGSGGPQRGATWVTDHALLDPKNMTPDTSRRVNDRGHKLTYGQFNAKMIGGVAHELGHALGLPHNRETPDERALMGKALMGAGNYTYRLQRTGRKTGAFITEAHAAILATHPLFNRTLPDDFSTPETSVENLTFDLVDGRLFITGTAPNPESVAAIVVYHDEMPTGINKDYDAPSVLAGMRSDGYFAAAIDLIKAGEHAVHLKVYFRNGSNRKFSYAHTVSGEMKPGLDALRAGQQWNATKTAFALKDVDALKTLVKAMEDTGSDKASRGRRFLEVAEQWASFTRPCDTPKDVKSLSLSSSQWESAEVGWDAPSFNGVLDPEGARIEPLSVGRKRYAQGLYAHAVARYEYRLDGQWKKLTASYGLQDRHPGSVVFVVMLDGKEAFRSRLTKIADGAQSCEIDVTGATTIELITEQGGDGGTADWGIWIEPMLTR